MVDDMTGGFDISSILKARIARLEKENEELRRENRKLYYESRKSSISSSITYEAGYKAGLSDAKHAMRLNVD